MVKILFVDVYSNAVWVTVVEPGRPIQVYVEPSTRIKPHHPVIWFLSFVSNIFPTSSKLHSYGTYSQNTGHSPARYPPFPPSLPAFNQVLKYGDLTANGRAGGRAGVKVDWAPMEATKDATNRPRCHSCIVSVFQEKQTIKERIGWD
jgi:hypothetical protein